MIRTGWKKKQWCQYIMPRENQNEQTLLTPFKKNINNQIFIRLNTQLCKYDISPCIWKNGHISQHATLNIGSWGVYCQYGAFVPPASIRPIIFTPLIWMKKVILKMKKGLEQFIKILTSMSLETHLFLSTMKGHTIYIYFLVCTIHVQYLLNWLCPKKKNDLFSSYESLRSLGQGKLCYILTG